MSTMGENDEDEDDDDTGASEADFDQVCSQTQFFYYRYFCQSFVAFVSLVTEVTYVYGDVDFSESPTQPNGNPLTEPKKFLKVSERKLYYPR